MLLNDGILTICSLKNTAAPGKMPAEKLAVKSKHWYGERTVGYGRYFTALQANNKIEMQARIWRDREILSTDYCVLEDGSQYQIRQVQHLLDEDGLPVTDLSLERLGEFYDVASDS